MFLVVIGISLSLISGIRINSGGAIQSDKDMTCYFTINQDTYVNVIWYRDGVQNLSANISCNNSVECYTSFGSGTVPNSYINRGEIWTCVVRFYNGTGYETTNTSVLIEDSPPSQPRIFWSNFTEIINTTASIPEDSVTTFIVNSTDKDGDTITYIINDSTYCNINGNTGILTCNPVSSDPHLGLKTITIGADTSYATTKQFFTINVTPTNAPPFFSPVLSNQSFIEKQKLNYLISGADYENNVPYTVTVVSVVPYLNLTLSRVNDTAYILLLRDNDTIGYNEAKLNYTVTLNISDNDNVTFNNRSFTGSFHLLGIVQNHLPNISIVINNNQSLIQGGDLSVYINATDIDNDTLIFSTGNPLYPITSNGSTDFNISAPNASFNYAWINITGMNNSYVANNNFLVYVFDGHASVPWPINLTITNTNDPPIIYNISRYINNTLNNTNISNLTGYTGVPFRYKVNASDPDDLTYDYNATGLGIYSTNDSRFPINSSTGVITFIPDIADNFTFTVTVTDRGGLSTDAIARIQVLPNHNPIFTKNPIIIYCYEYDKYNWNISCYYNISANVTDPDSITGDYVANYWTNSSMFTINSTSGIIRFNATQSMVGNNSIMLNVTDTFGGMNSTTIYVIINNTNNPPVLYAPLFSESGNFIIGKPYWLTYRASDLDLELNNTYENLTYNVSISGPPGVNISALFTLSKTNDTEALLAINPQPVYEGNYSINMTVTDYYGNTSLNNIHLYIYNTTAPPNITAIIPSGLPYNDTVDAVNWRSASDFAGYGMITRITIYENQTYIFNQTSVADNSSYPNSLNFEWYYDGVLSSTDSYFPKYFDFFSSNSTHNITLVAIDQYHSNASFTWLIDVINVNRPPTYNPHSLQNLSIPGSGFITSYLTNNGTPPDKRFYDPDDDPQNIGYSTDDTTNLIFSSTTCPYANFTFQGARLNIEANVIGFCEVMFIATDPLDSNMTVSSEIIGINITNLSNTVSMPIEVPIDVASSGGGTNTQPLPVPLPEEVEKPRPLQLITPKLVTTYKNATIKIPIMINNTWNDTLIGITLEAYTNATNVSLYLDRTYIPKLGSGEGIEATLYVKNYKSEGHYEIQIKANVTDPPYVDTGTIYINSAEMRSEGEQLENKISFAQDLLSSNPECQELNELLDQAKKELAIEDYEGTAKIVDNVLNGCKYLVNNAKTNKETPSRDFIKTFEWQKSYNDYVIIGIFGILFMVSIYYILKKDNSEQNF